MPRSENIGSRVVLITGASSGIGAATARTFAEAGAKLLLCARRLDKLKEQEVELLAAGAAAVRSEALDVADRGAVDALLSGDGSLPDEWKAIDVLINNAGLSRGLGKLYEDDPENWEEMINTNTKGLLYVTRAVVPGMVARARGHIVSLGSTAGHQTYAGGSVYCATKAAERVLSEGLKLDLMGTPVRVTTGQAVREHHTASGCRRGGCHSLGGHSPGARQYSLHPDHQHRPGQLKHPGAPRSSKVARWIKTAEAYRWMDQPNSVSFSSTSASASERAERRCALDVRSERMRSRCISSACRFRFCSASTTSAARRSCDALWACACCSSTDLLSHPRDIGPFYVSAFSAVKKVCTSFLLLKGALTSAASRCL